MLSFTKLRKGGIALAVLLALGVSARIPPEPWTANQLMKPEELAKVLLDRKSEKPLILYVGPPVLYRSAHIPGAKHLGPASAPEGVRKLKEEARNLARNKEIVLYCGCCPWKDCPNIRPAFKVMQEMAFTKVKALYLPNRFAQDWISKGLPTWKKEQALQEGS